MHWNCPEPGGWVQEKNTFFVIPARRDSKGFPFKNRILLEYTTKQISTELQEKTIVTTNDEEIIKKLSESKINVLKRDEQLCLDDANVKDVMVDVINKFHMKTNDIIVMLYLTCQNITLVIQKPSVPMT